MATSAPATEACLGVVLAGGRSRRMGRDKALLEWQGTPLIEHALRRFHEAGIVHTVVSGERPAQAGIPDHHPGAGPLAGLHAVARAYPGARLLLVPVDMPRLPGIWLAELASAVPEAAALHFENHPLPARIDATPELLQCLAAWLDDPQAPRSLKRLLRQLGASAIAAPERSSAAFDNANTPEDWARINA